MIRRPLVALILAPRHISTVRTIRQWAIAIVVMVLVSLPVGGARAEDVPRLSGRVTDQSGVLAADRAEVDAALQVLLDRSGLQLYVLFVNSTDGMDIAAFAQAVGQENVLGPRDALLVVAVDDRTDNITIGSDLTSQISQTTLDRIRASVLEPALTSGDYGLAVIRSADALGRTLLGDAYLLPAPAGTTVYISQGNFAGDHDATNGSQYALDFIVAGRAEFPVVAARAGRVIGARSDSTNTACRSIKCWTDANYVLVDHGDGTAALYLHLATGSVTVTGGNVAQGQTLGMADSTGWSTGTHLHFQLERTPTPSSRAGWWWSQSLPVAFADSSVLAVNADGVPTSAGGGYLSGNAAPAVATPTPSASASPSAGCDPAVAGVMDIWLWGSPDEGTPQPSIPDGFTSYLRANCVEPRVTAVAATDLVTRYRDAVSSGVAPEILAGSNYGPFEPLSSSIADGDLVVVDTSFDGLVNDNGFVILSRSADGFAAAVRLATKSPTCSSDPVTPNTEASLLQTSVRSYLTPDYAALNDILSPVSIIKFPASNYISSPEIPAVLGDYAVCREAGDGVLRVLHIAATYDRGGSTGSVGQANLTVVLIRDADGWADLTVTTDPITDSETWLSDAAIGIGTSRRSTPNVTALSPRDGTPPVAPTGERFGSFEWSVESTDPIVADYLEATFMGSESRLIPGQEDGSTSSVNDGGLWTASRIVMWRAIVINSDGGIGVSETRQYVDPNWGR